jgi:hypothetical protein
MELIKKHILGTVALLVGAAALTLGILAQNERQEFEALKQKYERDKGVTLEIKGFKFRFGDKHPEGAAPPEIPKYPPLTIATWATAILGLVLAPFSWVKEKQPVLSCSAIVLCAVALAWQYVLVGVAVGVAIAILAVIVSHS